MAVHRTERGQALPLVALCIVTLMVAAALAVDLGSLAATNRRLQAVADLAALDASRELTGGSCNQLVSLLPGALAQKDHVTAAAVASAGRNGFVPGGDRSIVVDLGLLSRTDPTGVPYPDGRPVFDDRCLLDPLTVPNAVRVRVLDRTAFAFGSVIGQSGRITQREAIAGSANRCQLPQICIVPDGSSLGTVRVGSRLASVNTAENRILNRLMGPLVGGTVNLDAVGWKGLADGNVTFSRLRTALGLTAGSTDQALDTTITYRQLLDASIAALNADGSPSALAARTPLAAIAAQATAAAGMQLKLRDLFDVTGATGSGTDVANATVNVLDIVRGGAIVADGNHFTSLNLAAADLAAIPGFNSATVKLGLIEGPQTKVGAPRDATGHYYTVAETSQVRVLVEVDLTLPLTGLGLVAVKVPYYLNAGNAKAYLESMQCSGSSLVPDNVKILGVTDAATTQLGAVADANLASVTSVPVPGTARLVSVAGLVTIDTSSVVTTSIPGNPGLIRTFTPSYTESSPSQSVNATAVTLPTLATGNLTVTTLGLSLLNTSAIKLDLANGVNAALPGLQSNLLNPLYRSLGLSYGGADLWAPTEQNCSPTSFSVDPAAPAQTYPVLGG